MGASLFLAVGLVLVIEGLLPLLAPAQWRMAMSRVLALADGQIRFFGLALLVAGLAVVALAS